MWMDLTLGQKLRLREIDASIEHVLHGSRRWESTPQAETPRRRGCVCTCEPCLHDEHGCGCLGPLPSEYVV